MEPACVATWGLGIDKINQTCEPVILNTSYEAAVLKLKTLKCRINRNLCRLGS